MTGEFADRAELHGTQASELGESNEPKGVRAVRDAAFVRISADVSLAQHIGNEVDIALMVRQIVYKDIIMGAEEQPVEVVGGRTLAEVARLRMPLESSANLALNILRECAVSGLLSLEGFDLNIGRVRQLIIDQDADDQAEV